MEQERAEPTSQPERRDVAPSGERLQHPQAPRSEQPQPTHPTASADDPSRGRPDDERDGGALAFLRELPVLLLIAFALAFVLRTFVVQVFYIPSGSMEPTLQVNDRMVVEKLTYRFREPARGEIVVFEGDEPVEVTPEQTALDRVLTGFGQFLGVVPANARDFVKRVVGLPGDTVEIDDGVVSINGVPIDEPYVVNEDLRDFGPVTVPEGALFFLGDNRPSSSDSRDPNGLGFVQADHVIGRAVLILWPLERWELIEGADYPPIPDATPAAPETSDVES